MTFLRRLFRRPDYTQAASLIVDDDVDRAEFARVFARASLDPRARRAIIPLFEASDGHVTLCEPALLRYLLGDINPDDILAAISVPAMTTREVMRLRRQVDIVKEILDGAS